MADDLDLDEMLDSALDEEFATSKTTAETNGEDDVELDLDAMLDEAMVSSAGLTAGEKQHVTTKDKLSFASKSRISSDFGPSQEWLERKQSRWNGAGSSGGKGPPEPFPFLRPERNETWKVTLMEDTQRQTDMDKQRPLSRAYRSFYSKGKGDGEIVVHLGSGASAKGKAEALQGGESRGGATGGIDGDEMSGTADEIFDDVFDKGVESSGVKEPPELGEEDFETLDRLKVSYLALVAKDVRARVGRDPDVSAERFPAIASKILGQV